MVIAILEPVFAGILVSLINRYVLSGSGVSWLRQSCSAEEVREDDDEEENEMAQQASNITTISDASVHVHCH